MNMDKKFFGVWPQRKMVFALLVASAFVAVMTIFFVQGPMPVFAYCLPCGEPCLSNATVPANATALYIMCDIGCLNLNNCSFSQYISGYICNAGFCDTGSSCVAQSSNQCSNYTAVACGTGATPVSTSCYNGCSVSSVVTSCTCPINYTNCSNSCVANSISCTSACSSGTGCSGTKSLISCPSTYGTCSPATCCSSCNAGYTLCSTSLACVASSVSCTATCLNGTGATGTKTYDGSTCTYSSCSATGCISCNAGYTLSGGVCVKTCSTGSVTVTPSTVTAQNTTALSAPASWTGGTFLSSNTSVLTVSGSTGTGKFAGSATVTGTGWADPYGATNCPLTGATATVLGTYTIDASVSALVGGMVQDHGYYDADGSGLATTTQTVTSGPTWSSSNTGIATISSSGLVTCVSAGTATITSVYQGVTATGSATCTSAKSCTVSASPNPIVSGNASSLSWSSTGVSACTWTSGLSGDAGISASSTSVSPVSTTTYAMSCDSGAATCSVVLGVAAVTQSTLSVSGPVYIGVGKMANFSATYSVDGTPGNNQIVTTQSSWSSNNNGVATSLGNGAFSGVGAGAAMITANYAPGNISATGTINVVQCKASDITITLRSGINTPMPNVPVTISTDAGSLTVTSGTTNAQGVIVTSLRGPIPSGVVSSPVIATITATAQGVVLTKTVTFDPASVCYASQIGMAPTNQTFASLGNLFATVFPYVHPSVLMGMAWGGGWGR